jgi:uncharacterized protein
LRNRNLIPQRRSIRKLSLLICAGLLVCAALAGWGFLIEPNRLVVHEERIVLPQCPAALEGLKIAAIGDLHAGSPFIGKEKLEMVVTRANATEPDLIVLLGDFMVQNSWKRRRIEPEVIAGILKSLHARLGVYAVLGNHDNWYNARRVTDALANAGIKVLENQEVSLNRNGQALWLVGLADLWTGRQRVRETLDRVPEGQPLIVLTHNPDLFPGLPQRVTLTLAAHTHGGQVNLPLLGRLRVPSEFGQRYAAGQIEEHGKHLFVTTGVGTSILPVRFRVPPEIAVVTVSSSQQR